MNDTDREMARRHIENLDVARMAVRNADGRTLAIVKAVRWMLEVLERENSNKTTEKFDIKVNLNPG